MTDMNVIIPGSVEYFLLHEGKITEEQIREAQLNLQDSKGELTTELVNLGYCTELDVAHAMEKKTGYKLVSIEEVGINAARYFFASKSLDTQIDFDINLATKNSNDNPVYRHPLRLVVPVKSFLVCHDFFVIQITVVFIRTLLFLLRVYPT